jgi:hypothetical protein
MEEEYRNCYSHYQYACYLEKNENRREAYRFYMKAQGELEALQIHCFSVANDTFIENVELLLRCIHHRVPVCMGLCIDEMRNVRKHLKEVRKSGTSPSYKLKLADIETDFDREIFRYKLTVGEFESLFPESEPEEYTDEEGDQLPPIPSVRRHRRPSLTEMPVLPRRRPHRPRCQTKAFKDMMSAPQPWDRFKPLVQTTPLKVTWLDIVGYEDVKKALHTELVNVGERLREERQDCPDTDPKQQETLSVLLFGPVGTGKSQLSDAIANEARECVYIKCKPSDLLAKYRGKSSKAIDLLFQMAAAHGPSIIFLDECEDLLANRDSDTGKSRTDMSSILLQNMTTYKNVCFLCATNLPWSLDAGYVRLKQKTNLGQISLTQCNIAILG